MHLSIDDKMIKSTRDKVNGGNTPYIVSAFLSDIDLSIGQLKVDDKSNEIATILELIKVIDIKDKVIIFDAIGTKKDICNLVTSKEKKEHFVLKAKDNPKNLKDDIKTYFDLGLKDDSLDIVIGETNWEKDQGILEKRKYFNIKRPKSL